MKSVAEAVAGAVDFPAEGECVTSPDYTFRIQAGQARRVEVSINGSLWEPCRRSVGYWWYDWSGYAPGRHQLVARMEDMAGRHHVARPRKFRVVF
ncbi:MAG: hypothetical protein KGL53_17255 [Elusimicrobia bacterium]|nr:hypothetical protein [Elusimicrobiota bacterium]